MREIDSKIITDTVARLCIEANCHLGSDIKERIETMKANTANMKLAAQKGFINATDLADYLVKKGLPFRSAYKISGQIVAKCIAEGKVLETLALEEYKEFSDLFEADLYQEIDLLTCVEKRISEGGTSVASVEAQIAWVKEQI